MAPLLLLALRDGIFGPSSSPRARTRTGSRRKGFGVEQGSVELLTESLEVQSDPGPVSWSVEHLIEVVSFVYCI